MDHTDPGEFARCVNRADSPPASGQRNESLVRLAADGVLLRWARGPAGPGSPCGMSVFGGVGGVGTRRHSRWAATQVSTARPRPCHRWNRSASWRASGAPRRAPRSPVPTDDLHAVMRGEPRGERCRFPARKNVDRAVAFAVRDHGGVRLSALGGEIVNAQHSRRAGLWVRQRHDPAQQGHPPCVEPELGGQPGNRPVRPAPARCAPGCG